MPTICQDVCGHRPALSTEERRPEGLSQPSPTCRKDAYPVGSVERQGLFDVSTFLDGTTDVT